MNKYNIRANYERIEKVGHVLAKIGFNGFVNLDKREPEYIVLEEIYRKYRDERVLLVLGLGVALLDYRLPRGGAYLFWNTFVELIKKELYPKKNPGLEDLLNILLLFTNTRACSRLRYQKKQRIVKYRSFAKYLWKSGWMIYAGNPDYIWMRLANTMGQSRSAKTIAFAMKVLDLITILVHGDYAGFKDVYYIPVDYHVARMSIYSGVIEVDPMLSRGSVSNIAEELTNEPYKNMIIEAWYQVSRIASKLLNKTINVFRIDTLLWRVSKTFSDNYPKNRAINEVVNLLVKEADIEESIARDIAEQLLYNF